MEAETLYKPCAKWTPDCQGKWDYDGPLISISTRYWPAGGGFHVLNIETGEFELSTRLDIKPSASASINLNHGDPDEYGYGDYERLTQRDFAGETEAQVKAEVESWVTEKVNEIAVVLKAHFGKQPEDGA